MKKISVCLWFDQNAEQAAEYYQAVFRNSRIQRVSHYGPSGSAISGQKLGSVLTVDMEIEDIEVQCLNGGPLFKFSPSFSFFVGCPSDEEIKTRWEKLSSSGQVRMELGKYPWAEMYGWTADKFGVDWQLIKGPRSTKIAPSFLFTDALFGRGQEAIDFYMSIFPNSKMETISHDPKMNTVMHAIFRLGNQGFTLMEGPGQHGHKFNEAFSLVVQCDDQKEIDFFWEKLGAGGSYQPCGWLKDKFGISWQIVPAEINELMASDKSEKVMSAMLKMSKLDIAKLKEAAK